MESEFLTKCDTDVRFLRPRLGKNNAPAKIQIMTEQILCEAGERQDPDIRRTKQKIVDPHESPSTAFASARSLRTSFAAPAGTPRPGLNTPSTRSPRARPLVWERDLEVDYCKNAL
uniref:Uncharacterized protein n=1 Tax=Ananas comosus var. bracteatus TaxID=296719 RepID=A0A6V7PUD1_ANACO|nr:unnamed protein product [Ananas comosus var. bracteatus]